MFTIIFTVFLDLVGVGIASPIIAPLLFRPESDFLPITHSEDQRTLLLGVLVAVFSVAGFFSGWPVLRTDLPDSTALVSPSGSSQEQGWTLGINQSVGAIGSFCPAARYSG